MQNYIKNDSVKYCQVACTQALFTVTLIFLMRIQRCEQNLFRHVNIKDMGRKHFFRSKKLFCKKHFLGVKKPFLRSQKMVMCFMYKSVLMDQLQFRNKNVLKCGKTSDLQAPALHTHLTQTRSDFSRDNIWVFFHPIIIQYSTVHQ